jgi:hypothetical protein
MFIRKLELGSRTQVELDMGVWKYIVLKSREIHENR